MEVEWGWDANKQCQTLRHNTGHLGTLQHQHTPSRLGVASHPKSRPAPRPPPCGLDPVWIPTKDNLADLFTKILPLQDFIRLRDQMLRPASS